MLLLQYIEKLTFQKLTFHKLTFQKFTFRNLTFQQTIQLTKKVNVSCKG